MKIPELAAVAFLMAAVAACGGGSSAPSPSPTPAPAPAPSPLGTAGVFDVGYGQFRGVYTFLDDGNFYGVHFVPGAVLAGHPHGLLSSADSATTPEPIAWATFIDDAHQVGAQESAGRFGRTFSSTALNVAIQGSMGSFTASASRQKGYGDGSANTLYGNPIPMSAIAGTYTGALRTVGIETPEQSVTDFVIDAGGAASVTSAGCSFTGTLTQHGATGIFDARFQTSGAGCGLSPVVAGIATPLSFVAGKPQLAVQLDGAYNAKTAVFIIDKS